jgi:hypothetical protein
MCRTYILVATHVRVVGYVAGYWHPMTFAVHALHIPVIVALLAHISGCPCCMRTGQTAGDQTCPCSDSRASSTSQRCARGRTKSGSNGGARNGARYRRPVWCRSANLFVGKLPAIVIVVAELFETSAGVWEGHHARTGRDAGARR